MRIAILTTGSGGHLFCGLSVAEEIKRRYPGIKIYLLGTDKSVSYRLFANSSIISQVVNILQSGLLFLYIRPNVVFSTGGFGSIGMVFWSWFFHRRCIIHEQNLVPGRANRLCSHFADKILVSFEETKRYFRHRCEYTGMPIRFKERLPQDEARKRLGLDPSKFTILVMGGSQGAHRINEVIVNILDRFPRHLQFIHLTGLKDLDYVKEAYRKNGFNAYIEGFSKRMDLIYSASNLVIGRAGSGMLAEITFFGLPCILIPYPYSKDRHQFRNAEYMARNGAGVVFTEDNVNIQKIMDIINSKDKLHQMAQNCSRLTNPYAAEKIVDILFESAH